MYTNFLYMRPEICDQAAPIFCSQSLGCAQHLGQLQVLDYDVENAIQRMTYAEVMERYGCDKPDLRYDLEMVTVSSAVKDSSFK